MLMGNKMSTSDFAQYDPFNWFWIVGGDTTRAYSSAVKGYVAVWDNTRVTNIDTEANMFDVLMAAGVIDTPAKTRLKTFQADALRAQLITQLKSATPAQVKTWVTNQGISDPNAIILLTKILLVLAPILNE